MSDAHFETIAIRTQAATTSEREHSVPLFLTSSFRFDDAEHARALFTEEVSGNIYSRYSNPNTDEFRAQASACSKAVRTANWTASRPRRECRRSSLRSPRASQPVITCSRSRAIFGSTHQIFTRILPKWGVESSYVDAADHAGWERGIRDNTKLIFIETPSNPGLELIDLEWLGNLARARGIALVVDNCFATPYLQRPLELGATAVVHFSHQVHRRTRSRPRRRDRG
jgi:O-succinylhomoserine sulfhydrylase